MVEVIFGTKPRDARGDAARIPAPVAGVFTGAWVDLDSRDRGPPREHEMARRLTGCALFALIAHMAFGAAPLAAQAYPARAVRLIVPGPPGGGADILARAVAGRLADTLGQPYVVDNRAGASGIIGSELVARAAPDGYTLLMGHSGTHAINASLRRTLPYHPVRDFTALARVAVVPNVLVVTPALPARDTRALLAMARARPGALTYASAGIGFSQHLAGVLFADMAGVTLLHVPYKGSAPGLSDVIAGHVAMMFPNVTAALPHIRSGRLRALGVTSRQRSDVLPDVPAIADTLPGYEAVAWFGLFAPAGLPGERARLLETEVTKALGEARVADLLRGQGADPAPLSGAAFLAFVEAEIAKWARVVRSAGLEGSE